MQKKFSFKNNRLAKTIVISGAILIAVAFAIMRYQGFLDTVSTLLHIFRPIIIGGVLAFALNRPMNFFQRHYRRLFTRIKISYKKKRKSSVKNAASHQKQQKHHNIHIISKSGKKKPKKTVIDKASHILACLTTYAVSIAIVVGICIFVIPQIYDSIILFGTNLNNYISNFKDFISENKLHLSNIIGDTIDVGELIEKLATKLNDFIANFAEHIPDMLQAIMDFTSDIIGIVVDIILGLVFSVYILLDKENLKRNAQRVTKLIVKDEHYPNFSKIVKMAYTTFTNFISGQIIEASIVAVMCFIGMNIFGFDYALLISVIVGITNLIPIVGPIIGTIPGAFILLLIKPIDAFWFVVFIICIQQIDMNIICPRVVGNKMGLPGLWVLFAITIGGGLAGVMGMILGVPILSIIYALISEKLEEAEQKTAQSAEE